MKSEKEIRESIKEAERNKEKALKQKQYDKAIAMNMWKDALEWVLE